MNSQMRLSFFIGDVLVAAVVLVVALILAWASLKPLTDACTFGYGIGDEVLSLTQSAFSVGGSVTYNYMGPNICRINGKKIMCNPLNGWNPNITIVSIGPDCHSGIFGFDDCVPLSLKAKVNVNWEEGGTEHSKDIDVLKMYTYSMSRHYSPKEDNTGTKWVIEKESTVYGDVVGEDIFRDPLILLANKILEERGSCKSSDTWKWEEMKINIPASYQIVWKDDELCVEHLYLNVHASNPFDLRSVIRSYDADSKEWNKIKNTVGFAQACYTYLYDDKDYSKAVFRHKGALVLLQKNGISGSHVGTLILQSSECSDDVLVPKGKVDISGVYLQLEGWYREVEYYDPYDQSNVAKYNTGWKVERCFDFSRIGNDFDINGYQFSFSNKISDVFSASDGYNHVLMDFNRYNQIKIWDFNVSYNCQTNETKIELLDIKDYSG